MKYIAGLTLILGLTACNLTGSSGPSGSPSGSPSAAPSASASAPVVQGACPSSAAVDTSGWQTVSETGFSFKLPPGYRKAQVQGIDSLVGRWAENEKRFVMYDYGGFSSTLDEARDMLETYSECSIETGSLKARVVSGFDRAGNWDSGGPKYVVAGAWRNIKPGTHLSFTTTDAEAAGAATLYAILRSVRFTN